MPDSHPPKQAGSLVSLDFSAATILRAAGEVLFLVLCCFTTWFYAGLDEQVLSYVSFALLVLVSLWVAHSLVEGQLNLKLDLISWCMVGLIGLTVVQLIPLPDSVVGLISPARLNWHMAFLPDALETVQNSPATLRSSFVTLSVYPEATRQLLTQLIAIWLFYAVARNWLASRDAFRRLAWAFTINGVLLAMFSLGHAFSAKPGMIYWTESVSGAAVFGPFVCRNHYPDYIALCAAMAFGLMLTRQSTPETPDQGIKPKTIGLACALGLMLVSVIFSLSRGGAFAFITGCAIAWLVSRISREKTAEHKDDPVKFPLVVVIAIALIVTAWFGTAAVEQRLKSSHSAELFGARWQIWSNCLSVFPGTWLVGSGGGSFPWIQLMTRSAGNPDILNERAHNEYLEALIEGGVLRFALTVTLVGTVLFSLIRGFLARRSRSVGSLLLGAVAAMTVAAVHNLIDFGIRIPAVAMATVALVAYSMAAARDPEFIPARVRVRRYRSEGVTITETLGEEPAPSPPPSNWEVRGIRVGFVGLILIIAAGIVAWDYRLDWVAIRYRAQAEIIGRTTEPDRFEMRAKYLLARAEMRPTNAEAQADAAQSLLDAANFKTWTPSAGLAGGAAGYLNPPTQFPASLYPTHIWPAIQLLQKARSLNPLLPIAHGRLALLAAYYSSQESSRASFERFQKLSKLESDVWYLSGREAFRRGDLGHAWADWQQALKLSGKHLKPILEQAETRLSLSEMKELLLPKDPLAVSRVVEQLHPRPTDPTRREFLLIIAGFQSLPKLNADQWLVIAQANSELDLTQEAESAWQEALRAGSDRVDIRDKYCRWLEQEERYKDAIIQLDWLLQNERDNRFWQERLEAARHGLSLEKRISGK
jgi:tetratricopeptide (TPR) repeat protein